MELNQDQQNRLDAINKYFEKEFMKPQILREPFVEIEGNCTDFVPLSVTGLSETHIEIMEQMDIEQLRCADGIKTLFDFTDNSEDNLLTVRLVSDAIGFRLSAPGYTDCTEWTAFDKFDDLLDHIELHYMD
jgi:hypothetical protein